jgi:hypothetical protein
MNSIPYIIIAGIGSARVLGEFYTFDYDRATRLAAKLNGVVANTSWYRRTFGVDPLQPLKCTDAPVRMGRPPRGRRIAA